MPSGGVKTPLIWIKICLVTFDDICAPKKKAKNLINDVILEHPTLHGGIQISLKLSQKYARNEVHIKEFFVSFTIEKFENILGMYGLHFLIYLK